MEEKNWQDIQCALDADEEYRITLQEAQGCRGCVRTCMNRSKACSRFLDTVSYLKKEIKKQKKNRKGGV